VDPRLSSPYHDIHIQPGSPCINAGDDSVVTSGETDIDGQPRIIGAHVDIGSDESDGTTWTVPQPRTWYVLQTGNDGNDGSSWSKAKKTVGGALTVAQGTDEVWVAKGFYAEGITVPAGVALYGGFGGTETSRAQRNWNTNVTTLAGASSTLVQATVLDGFTIHYDGSSSGVIVVNYSTASISNCAITGNDVGVYVYYGAASITNCIVSGNGYGVNVPYSPSAVTITDSAISGNGDGVDIAKGVATIANCTITGNGRGVGLIAYASTLAVTNCIAAYNQVGIFDYSSNSLLTLSHNDSFGNTESNYYNIAEPTGTNGNISADPLFVNRTAGDYLLVAGSPCIDTGDDTVLTPGETDLDGNPRKFGAHVDMGAYEYGAARYVLADVVSALRIAGGLAGASSKDVTRLNVVPGTVVNLLDAVRLARKVAGLESNP
jgi:hypothetical protein